jgi:hypothetical protein
MTRDATEAMTQRKPRFVEPYTMNMAVAGLGGFEGPLKEVLGRYFCESACDELSERILDAITRYHLDVESNPDRKVTRLQQKDRSELIETMKELNQRLHPLHIPLPLYEPAKIAYTPSKGGKAKLGEEISDLLLRLGHLQRLFESIEIKTPATTNPGKPERNGLVDSLEGIFYAFANAPGNLENLKTEKVSGGMSDIRLNFITDIFEVFNLPDPLPRNA